MTENGLFVLAGPEMQLHDILWAVHDEKTMIEARARKILGNSRLGWVVGDKRCIEGLRVSLVYICVCVWETLGSN